MNNAAFRIIQSFVNACTEVQNLTGIVMQDNYSGLMDSPDGARLLKDSSHRIAEAEASISRLEGKLDNLRDMVNVERLKNERAVSYASGTATMI